MKKYNLIKLLSAIALTFTLSACTEDEKVEMKTTEVKTVEVKKEVQTKAPVEVNVSPSKDLQVDLGACKGCHGANFEKEALGKSKIVSDMTKAEVSASLIGYKDGTYGAAMKSVMVGQVSKYSDEALSNTGLGK